MLTAVLRCAVCLLLWCVGAAGYAVEIRLASPLNTMADVLSEFPASTAVLSAQVQVPAGAPTDVLVGAYAQEDGGHWRQAPEFIRLKAGSNAIALTIPGRVGAAPTTRAVAGLVFSAVNGAGVVVQITDVRVETQAKPVSRRVLDIVWDEPHPVIGAPWLLHLRPESNDGFMLSGQMTAADGTITTLAGHADGSGWSLQWTPPQAGAYQLMVQPSWQGIVTAVPPIVLTAIDGDPLHRAIEAGPVPGQDTDPVQKVVTHSGPGIQLQSPLRSCWGAKIADGFAACRIRARVLVGDDAPADLIIGAYAIDHAGRWRQSTETLPLHPGEQTFDLLVPAGLLEFDSRPSEHGDGEAGLVCWSAQVSTVCLPITDVHIELVSDASARPATDIIGLDRLRLDGVTLGSGGMTATVGSTWSASVVPTLADGERPGVRFSLSARLTDADGRHQIVAGIVDADGRYRVTFHPSLPGISTVSLIGTWSDGHEVESVLSHITVVGPHPCPHGQIISVQGPLTRVVPLAMGPVGARNRVEATVVVPDGAPRDLTAAVVAIDHDSNWFQQSRPQPLHAGINTVSFLIDRDADVAGEPAAGIWTASSLTMMEKTGLAISTVSSVPTRIILHGAVARPLADPAAEKPVERLVEVSTSALSGITGERWSVSLRPEPFPDNPYDPDEFRLDMMVITPDGTRQLVPGFYSDDMMASDRGDHELLRPVTGGFQVRYRPRMPGVHRLELQATWRNGQRVSCILPPLSVSGANWDGYVRVDRSNPHFFAVDGKFFWPVGPNLRSVWDLRAQERMHTTITPDRGTLAYDAYLQRFAAAGANACEIWMSAWNLALEWRRDWPGFAGVGRYNQSNAWRLDHILDTAWAAGMRVNLVINNHGQASEKTDAEWDNNPYNLSAGGQLRSAAELFQAPYALKGQDNLRRYVIARYADHPAVMGWKLWTEMDLTNGGPNLQSWHERATKRWRELDVYGHPVASHWCGDYTHPSENIVSLLDYVCIDAYHGDEEKDRYRLVHRLLRDSTLDVEHGLAQLGRPVLVTEYGGNWSGTRTDELMLVDHSCGAWVGLVSGHAGAPMLWWFEWVDQGNRFGPYGAIGRFVAGEDLRDGGHACALRTEGSSTLWSAAWRTRTRLFGYVIDERWAADGHTMPAVTTKLILDEDFPAGTHTCEWWDPDQGKLLVTQTLVHAGGVVRLTSPTFRKHVAWKFR